MISVVANEDGTQITVCGDDMRFSRFTDYLDALVPSTIDPIRAPFVTQPDELYRLSGFNETDDMSLLSHDIITLFHYHAEIHPELAALHANNRDYSYSELNRASDQMACWLLEQDGNNDTLVAVAMQKSALLLIILLGILKSNKTYVLLDPQAPKIRNQSILDDVQPTLILADSPLKAGNAPSILPSTINYQTLHVSTSDLPTVNNESLAYVCYTSGTTGKPKGVMITREGLSNVAQNHRDFMQLGIGSRVLAIASLGFDAFGWDVYGALVSGATLYLAPAELHTDIGALHHYLAQHEVEHVTITPAILELLPRNAWQGLRSMIVMGDSPHQTWLLGGVIVHVCAMATGQPRPLSPPRCVNTVLALHGIVLVHR